MRKTAGFTLIEALISLAIFSFLGVGAYQLLNSTSELKRSGEARFQAIAGMQMALRLLEEDFTQIVPRGVRSDGELTSPALDGDPVEGVVEFTRTGWRNPLGAPRSRLQRVLWEIDDEGRLLRRFWPGPDARDVSDGLSRVAATDIETLEIRYLDETGEWVESWPPEAAVGAASADAQAVEPLPVAVELRLVQKQVGEVLRVVVLR